MSPGERDEEPPDEKEDFVLHFEDVDKLPARDLDTITAWMQSMLASFYQLCNVEVSISPSLCLVACGVTSHAIVRAMLPLHSIAGSLAGTLNPAEHMLSGCDSISSVFQRFMESRPLMLFS